MWHTSVVTWQSDGSLPRASSRCAHGRGGKQIRCSIHWWRLLQEAASGLLLNAWPGLGEDCLRVGFAGAFNALCACCSTLCLPLAPSPCDVCIVHVWLPLA